MVCLIEYSRFDVQRMEPLLAMLKERGTWMCPITRTAFTFNKKDKTYTIDGDRSDPTNLISTTILERELGYREDTSERADTNNA